MLEQLAYVADILAATGVVLSLVYVARQLKQTNSMSRSAVRQTLNSKMIDFGMTVSSSLGLAEAMAKVHFDGLQRNDATNLERIQLGYSLAGLINLWHLAFEHRKEGILTEQELTELFGTSTTLFRQPYLRSVWPTLASNYPQDFSAWLADRFELSNGRLDAGESHR